MELVRDAGNLDVIENYFAAGWFRSEGVNNFGKWHFYSNIIS